MPRYFFEERRQQLGQDARLAVSFYLLFHSGDIIIHDGFNQDALMPMASTFKVAIAFAILHRIFSLKNLKLDDPILISNQDFAAGLPTNSLDRYFFMPWCVSTTKTVDELLTYMLSTSDNTATDVLLRLAGGPAAVNRLIASLNLGGTYSATSNCKELLAAYYNTSIDKSFFNILNTFVQFLSGFKMRPTEKTIFENNRDVCTPEFSNNFLQYLIKTSVSGDEASKLIIAKMQNCITGKNMIRKALEYYDPIMIGDKTGSIGGVTNDTAYVHLPNDMWIVLSIYSCYSPLEKAAREKIIADLTTDILRKHLIYNKQPAIAI